jgi:hypothetical protein
MEASIGWPEPIRLSSRASGCGGSGGRELPKRRGHFQGEHGERGEVVATVSRHGQSDGAADGWQSALL